MNPVRRAFGRFSAHARERRAEIFRSSFDLGPDTRLLDLGSETGANIHAVLEGTPVRSGNVYIADIDESLLERGRDAYGFVGVLVDESGRLPFDDGFFDIVYCSSVIEHVTVPKERVWTVRSGRAFAEEATRRQAEFAAEIRRLGTQYFVQTPNRFFPVESHSWLPFASYLPRRVLVGLLRITNAFWVKSTTPDWRLLTPRELAALFPDATIVLERSLGLTKSLMAVRSDRRSR